MRQLIENRIVVSAALGAAIGLTAFFRLPFPDENGLLQLVFLQKPAIFQALKFTYVAMLFTMLAII